MKSQVYSIRFCIVLHLAFLGCFSAVAQDWETILSPVTTNLILYDITFPPGQSDIGFTGGANLTYNGKGKILKTINHGMDWEIIYESEENGTGVSAIKFLDLSKGFAGTHAGNLMSTTDGGDNWTSTDFDPNTDQGEIYDIEFYDDNNGVILSIWGGVYITSDGGDSWTSATVTIPGAAYELVYADATTLFAVGNQQNIYKSTDGGDNWSNSFTGSSPWMINLGVNFSDANHGLVTSEDGNTFVTSDGGDTWTNYVVPNQGGLMRGALVIDENNMYATGTPGAVYKTIDGGVNWTLDSPVDFQPSYYKIIRTDNGSLFVTGSGSTGGTILRKVPLAPVTVNTTIENLACNSDNTGAITLEVQGGSTPYTFDWSNGETTQNISNLPADTYACTITDDTGTIVVVDNLVVSEPASISASIVVSNESIQGANDGSLAIDSLSGGAFPYTFLWDNGAITGVIQNLTPGDYCVTITDANNCEFVVCGSVSPGVVANQGIPNLASFELLPNPVFAGGHLILQLQFDNPTNIQATILNAVGQEVAIFNNTNTTTIQKAVDLSSYPSGVYIVHVTVLENGGTASKKLLKVE